MSQPRERLETRRQTSRILEFMQKSFQQMKDGGCQYVDEILSDIPSTPSSLQTRLLGRCQDIWDFLPQPWSTVPQHLSAVAQYNNDIVNRQAEKELWRQRQIFHADTARGGPRLITINRTNTQPGGSHLHIPELSSVAAPPSLLGSIAPPDAEKMISRTNQQCVGFCPKTKKPLEKVLAYPYQVKITDLDQCIRKFPGTTDKINIYESFIAICQQGVKIGYSRENFRDYLKLFIFEHFNTSSYIIANEEDPDRVVEAFLNLINVNDVLSHITQSINSITRKETDPVTVAFDQYKSLIRTQLQYKEPHITTEALNGKVDRLSKQFIFQLVTPETKKALQNFKDELIEEGSEVTAQALLQECSSLESMDPSLLPQSDIKPGHQDATVFKTRISSHVTTRTQAKSDGQYQHTSYEPPKRSYNRRNDNRSRPTTRANTDTRATGNRSPYRSASRGRSRTPDRRHQSRDARPRSADRARSRSPYRPSPASSDRRDRSYSRDRSRDTRSSYRSSSPGYNRSSSRDRNSSGYDRNNNNNKSYYPSSGDRNRSRDRRQQSQDRYRQRSRSSDMESLQRQLSELSHKINRKSSGYRDTCLKCLGSHDTDRCEKYRSLAPSQCTCLAGRHYRNRCLTDGKPKN